MSDDKPKQKRERPVMFIFQYLDTDGVPAEINKEQINILAVTRDAGKALEVMESAELATFRKVTVTQYLSDLSELSNSRRLLGFSFIFPKQPPPFKENIMTKSISSLYSNEEFALIQLHANGTEDTANVEEFQRKATLFVSVMLDENCLEGDEIIDRSKSKLSSKRDLKV